MEITLEEVAVRVLGLPASSRAMLAEKLIQRLDDTEEDEVEKLWVEEAEARLQSIPEGKKNSTCGRSLPRSA